MARRERDPNTTDERTRRDKPDDSSPDEALEGSDAYGGPDPMDGPEAVGFDPTRGPSPHPEGSPADIGVGTLDQDAPRRGDEIPRLTDYGAGPSDKAAEQEQPPGTRPQRRPAEAPSDEDDRDT